MAQGFFEAVQNGGLVLGLEEDHLVFAKPDLARAGANRSGWV